MKLIKSRGIAHHSYFIEANGQGIVIDPRRDIDIYLKIAETRGLNITHIFETHRNEDYVIGSIELAQATGAEIFHGKNLEFAYGTPVSEGKTFMFGNVELEILETPGHTMESISLILRDKDVSEDAQMVFTGDLIFAGETGRVDLLGVDQKRKMAGLLYDSIFQKIIPLGDETILCPAHGAGSICGVDIRQQDYTTIGYERKTNPQLQCNKNEFIQGKIEEKNYTPPYFKKMELYNQNGAPILGRLLYLRALTPKNLKEMKDGSAQIVDVRHPTSFGGGHIPHSLNIWQEGVPAFAGWFLNYHDPIILVDDHGHNLDEIRKALIRLGFDNIYGYLAGGFPNWYLHAQEIETLKLWSVQQLKENLDGDFFLLDVRKIGDRREGYIEGAHHIYTGEVPERLSEIPHDQPVVVYCDSGFKSTLICSYLKREGFHDLVSVLGSMTAWKQAHYPVVKD